MIEYLLYDIINMKLIVGFCRNRGIGWKNSLPWHLKDDLLRFKNLTIGDGNNAVIMGRKTWESLPEQSRPLPKRTNIVLSRTSGIKIFADKLEKTPHFYFPSLEMATPLCNKEYDDAWIIGGEKIYRDSLEKNLVQTVYTTYIDKEFPCDAFFPTLPNYYVLESQTPWEYTTEYRYRFQKYQSIHKFFRFETFK